MKTLNLVLLTLALPLSLMASDETKAKSAIGEKWKLEGAKERIEKYRKGERTVVFVDGDKKLSGEQVQFELTNLDFLFGTSLTQSVGFDEPGEPGYEYHDNYWKYVKNICNVVTVGYYWSGILYGSPEDYHLDETSLKWARENGMTIKGHPMAWHNSVPPWAIDMQDPEEMMAFMKQHIKNILAMSPDIKLWDVYNEAVGAFGEEVVESGVRRWLRSYCSPRCSYHNKDISTEGFEDGEYPYENCVDLAMKDLYAYVNSVIDDDVRITLNHYSHKIPVNPLSGRPRFLEQCEYFEREGVEYDVIGIQTHMHEEFSVVSEDEMLQLLEDYSKFGKPIHFTEVTVPSFEIFKSAAETLAHEQAADKARAAFRKDKSVVVPYRASVPEYEQYQAQYMHDFLTTAFSYPNVELFIVWNFTDNNAWRSTASGIVDLKNEPKPAYRAIEKLLKEEWHTAVDSKTNRRGKLKFKGFYGDYKGTINGKEFEFKLSKDSPKEIVVEL